MSKINLLVSNTDNNSFCSEWFSSALAESFNLIYYEDGVPHSKTDTVCVTNFFNKNNWYKPLVDSGYKLIIDHFWDSNIFEVSDATDNVLTVRNKNWLWYNESLWYAHLRYDQYRPNKNYSKTFLMLMRLKRPHRDTILNRVDSLLDSALYSYLGNNIQIDGDLNSDHGDFQRYFNPDWYNSTSFSLVVESNLKQQTFVSEKTFKPIAYYHPMVIWGSPGLLDYLHKEQFETFDHIIDESYDTIKSDTDRLDKVVDIVTDLTQQFKNNNHLFDDAITKEKLQYNHNRFFNKQLVQQKINDEIISTILNFIE